MNEMASRRRSKASNCENEPCASEYRQQNCRRRTRLRARWFVRNARRDGRRRVERLYEISLRRAVGVHGSKGGRQPHAVARGTVAASVALVGPAIIMLRVELVIVMMAFGNCTAAMVVVCGHHTDSSLRTRIRAAQRHDCRSVRLERHREHQKPQHNCAKSDHRRIVEERPRFVCPQKSGLRTEAIRHRLASGCYCDLIAARHCRLVAATAARTAVGCSKTGSRSQHERQNCKELLDRKSQINPRMIGKRKGYPIVQKVARSCRRRPQAEKFHCAAWRKFWRSCGEVPHRWLPHRPGTSRS